MARANRGRPLSAQPASAMPTARGAATPAYRRWWKLTVEVARKRRAAVAEAIAAERALALDDLRTTVKALTATPHPAPPSEPAHRAAPSLTAKDLAEFEALADAAERGELRPLHLDPVTKAAVAAEAAEIVRRAFASPAQTAAEGNGAGDGDGADAAAWAEHPDRDRSPATLLRGPAAREYTDALLSDVLADAPDTAALFHAARTPAQPTQPEPSTPSRWQRLRRRLAGPSA